jgi:hypothetical protein
MEGNVLTMYMTMDTIRSIMMLTLFDEFDC